MLCILSRETNPYFNLAAEEYLFKNIEEDVFFLYVNTPAVVVGKHQNALAEVNPEFIRDNNVSVIRRLSGGGAVYHDLGNLNFSFHQTVEDTSQISFKTFNEPIVEVLHQLGVPAEISKRNDIFVEGFKVSGHAEHVFRNRILSHGTLLFNAKKDNLSKALKNQSGRFSGKAIQSLRSKVANIVDFMDQPITLQHFIKQIQNHIFKVYNNSKVYGLTDSDIHSIQLLLDEKYSSWDWNFGYSPKYRFEKKLNINEGFLELSIGVEKGIMKEVNISSNGLMHFDNLAVQNSLKNSPHKLESIIHILSSLHIDPQVSQHLLKCFF